MNATNIMATVGVVAVVGLAVTGAYVGQGWVREVNQERDDIAVRLIHLERENDRLDEKIIWLNTYVRGMETPEEKAFYGTNN